VKGVALIDFIDIAKIRLSVFSFWKPRRSWEILDDRLARRLPHHFKAARDRGRASSWLADGLRRFKRIDFAHVVSAALGDWKQRKLMLTQAHHRLSQDADDSAGG
jgi:hypothetical protein